LLRLRVEEAAIKATTAYFEAAEYDIKTQEKENLGWDLLATCGTRQLQLEVKGLSGSTICIELTPNEYKQMQKLRDSYCVCIVTNALTSRDVAVFSYSPESKTWQDSQKRTLQVQEIMAARCYLG
jgi:hypothetical protein